MICPSYDFSRHKIQDPIHGTIKFGPLERAFIDHPLFQRLHGLRQNSLLYLIFPSANHTRFDHSIGVMDLAARYFDSIVSNQEHICSAGKGRSTFQGSYRVDTPEIEDLTQTFSSDHYFRIVVRSAALFHDIGHGPLSHLFDNFFPPAKALIKILKEPQYSHIVNRLKNLPKMEMAEPVEHEILSCLCATQILLDNARLINDMGIDPKKMIMDICSAIDDKFQPSEYCVRFAFRANELFHDIISSMVDADRMDYLLRDSHMCGVSYGLYDTDRILKSMCFYGTLNRRSLRLAIRYSGLGAFEDLILSRYQMHAQIYGHKTNCSCSAMLQEILKQLKHVNWNWYEKCETGRRFIERFATFDDKKFVNLLTDQRIDKGTGKVKEIATSLFFSRKLFKRVYEERVSLSANNQKLDQVIKRKWNLYQNRLRRKRIAFMGDIFVNKGVNVNVQNYPLKVLRKDPRTKYYQVHELKDFSTVVKYLPEKEKTYRVYCPEEVLPLAKAELPL